MHAIMLKRPSMKWIFFNSQEKEPSTQREEKMDSEVLEWKNSL
jgi:hypothetical protein